MQIFYINLAHRADRRDHIERQLADLGLTATRIEAVTPGTIPKDMLRFTQPSAGNWVAPSQLACTLSHRAIWRRVVEQRLSCALILEDDAVLSRQFAEHLPEIEGRAVQADVIHLETRNFPVTVESGEGLKRIYSFMPGTAAYVVSYLGAERLMSGRDLGHPVDDYMFDPRGPMFDKLVVLQAVPALCTTADVLSDTTVGASDIGAEGEEREAAMAAGRKRPHALLRRIVSRIREEVRQRSARGAERKVVPFAP